MTHEHPEAVAYAAAAPELEAAANPKHYAVLLCEECGAVPITEEQYIQQMNLPNRLWFCVKCDGDAEFDENEFSRLRSINQVECAR